ncbi:hypothetical protein EDB92DRAFT_1868796 [Lactarius akahatsu]|uniref:Transmembrane protein n=1 Tax=Lactarius akahatsu TaxID=416441 RepID=A0AAD4LF40_9AGAM|nr:hypothetical protein EDB92DRAFT_1868796 [Lactarius akahatsu]
MSDSGSGSESSDARPEPPQKDVSPWIPVSMLAVTTVALAVPLVLLRRQRARASALNKSVSSSMTTSAPPLRRAPIRGVPSTAPPPRAAPALTPSVEAISPSAASSRVAQEDGFNGALYSLKAFSIATALVVAGGAASVWGVKTYLGVRDTQEFASAMRLTLLTKWPLLASRIHRASDSAPLPPPIPLPVMIPSASKSDPLPPTSVPDADGWTWPAAQARLAEAYEHGGVGRFAETAAGELEAEAELERRKRGLAVLPQARTPS